VFCAEWVQVRNLMNSRFRAGRPCSICRALKCELVWYSIKTSEVRCRKCFDAEREHYRRADERAVR